MDLRYVKQTKDGMTELMIQKVTVDNMDVMFALCMSSNHLCEVLSP